MVGSREWALRIQRARILDAMVLVVCERSFAGASVSSVSARAKVSRRAFYEAFDGLEDCFLAVLDDGASHASMLISRAFDREESWLDGVRGALAALLAFFDSEPAFAQVLLVEASAAGPRVRDRRERHIAMITSLVEERWGTPEDAQTHPLATAGVMASLLGVLHTHLVTARNEPRLTLRPCWRPSRCGRLSRPRSTTVPPPRPRPISRQRALPAATSSRARRGRFLRSP